MLNPTYKFAEAKLWAAFFGVSLDDVLIQTARIYTPASVPSGVTFDERAMASLFA